MTAVIQTEKLTKYYGKSRGIIGVDLESTRTRSSASWARTAPERRPRSASCWTSSGPRAVRARVFGKVSTEEPVAIHRRVGYMPGEFALYDRLTGGQTIEYFANLRGGVDRAYQAVAHRALRRSIRASATGSLSKGNKQKVGRDHRAPAPAPAAGPRRTHVRTRPARPADVLQYAVARRTRKAATVFLSSHILSEVERTCDRVAIIREGKIVKGDTGRGACETSPTTRSSCGSQTMCRSRRSRHCPASATSWPTTTRCACECPAPSRPSSRRRQVRAARLRQPRADPGGDVPGPVRDARVARAGWHR